MKASALLLASVYVYKRCLGEEACYHLSPLNIETLTLIYYCQNLLVHSVMCSIGSVIWASFVVPSVTD